jgi:anti-sigma B factor antagonist
MPFKTKEEYNAVIFQISGKFLGSIEGAAFKDRLEELKTEGKTNVVVDLSKADFMDSSGIGTLIGALTTMRKAGGDLKLACMKDRIKNLFVLTRLLGPIFTDYETVEEAAEALAKS